MKKLRLTFTVAASMAMLGLAVSTGRAEQGPSDKQRLFMEGARLWPVYCAQCHKARPSSEFSPDQWNTIIMHMRSRANMPAKDANAILEFLKTSH